MAKAKKINYKELSEKELTAKLNSMKKEYMDFRFKMVISHVVNPLQKRTMRREIARVSTFLRQKELQGKKAKKEGASTK